MKLAVVQIKGSRADAVVQGLLQRGFAVDVVSE